MNKIEIIDLFEFGDYKKLDLDDNKIKELKSLLKNVWSNRKDFTEYDENFEEVENNEDKIFISELKKQPFIIFNGNRIRARNYIGFIEFENYRINIHPKIFKPDPSKEDIESDKSETTLKSDRKSYFKNILYWLSYCEKIKFPFKDISPDLQDFDSFLEVFIYIFASYTQKILAEKPYSRYQEVKEETTFLRGSLAISEYTRENLITGRWHHFFCNYETFIYDNLFNQIVKYVSKMLLNITSNENNTDMLENIIFILDDVDNIACTYNDCNKISFNRMYEDVDIILTMCKMFLSGQLIDSSVDDKVNFCFLIPMEKVFEEFIFNFIQKEITGKKNNLKLEDIKSQDGELSLAKIKGEDVFKLKYDILIENRKLIIDTKYKIRNKSEKRNKGISQGDMYQMVSYGLKRGFENIVLLYPQAYNKTEKIEDDFIIESVFSGKVKIKVKAIDLSILVDNKDKLIDDLSDLLNGYPNQNSTINQPIL